jgi:large subunit ribosomal protein L21
MHWKKSELAAFRAGAPAGGFFAIVELAGKQHKIMVDSVIVSAKLKPVTTYSVGSVHTFKDVLLVGSSHLTLVGLPFVGGAEVDVMVEEITKDAKVIVFKKRRRKNSRRKKGHRRDVTMLRVLDIRMPSEHKDHCHVARKESAMDV